MPDLKRHSEGYWRSLFIFDDCPQVFARNRIRDKIEEMGLVYSYCYYGNTEEEKAHITFRILFPDLEIMKEFSEWVKEIYAKQFEDHNYDEEPYVKWAYVAGTQCAEALMDVARKGIPMSSNFLRLALHGMFNNLTYSYRDEMEMYLFLMNEMLTSVFGFRKR